VGGAVDDFFDSLDASTRSAFEHISDLVLEVVPAAEQRTSYGIAAFTYRLKPLLGFRVAKDHLSIFPFSSEVVEAVRERLAEFDVSKGTIRFAESRPLPDDVVRDIVRLRMREIFGGER
jgi:uncharacterized protein YdhG (YjbR/CyaY superfamily)